MNEFQKMKIKLRKSKEISVRQKGPQRKRTKARKTKQREGQSEEKAGKQKKTWKAPEGHEQEWKCHSAWASHLGRPQRSGRVYKRSSCKRSYFVI